MNDEVWRRDEVDSPCVKICLLHPDSRLCIGCWRSVAEIACWTRMTDAERQAVMADLPSRRPEQRRRGGRAGRLERDQR